jgi:hypothetical protein
MTRLSKTEAEELENPTSSTVRLEQIYQLHPTPATLKRLLKHPGCPPRLIAEYLTGHLPEICENPALPLLFLENPAFLYDATVEQKRSSNAKQTYIMLIKRILRRADIPAVIAQSLAFHPNKIVSQNAKMHVQTGKIVTPENFLSACEYLDLLTAPEYIKGFLCENNFVPKWLLPLCTASPKGLARYRAKYRDTHVPMQSRAMLHDIQTLRTKVKQCLGGSPPEHDVTISFVHHPEFNDSDYAMLYPIAFYHDFLIQCPHLKKSDVLELWNQNKKRHDSIFYINAIISNHYSLFIETEIRDILYEWHLYLTGSFIEFCCLVKSEESELLQTKSESHHWDARLAGALNSNTPKEIVSILANDGNVYVRCAAQCRCDHPNDWQERLGLLS